VAEGIDGETADLGLKDLETRHISELHELAAAAGVPRFRTMRRSELAAAINAALASEAPSVQAPEQAPEPAAASTPVPEPPPAPVPERPPSHLPEPAAAKQAFAIIRLERGSRWTPAPKPEQVSVEKIVSSESDAEREAERLNAIAQAEQTGVTYFARPALIEIE
jgi:hypothetical protein